MVSGLAAQLAQGISLNASLLGSRRKPTESYLFSSKEAQQHDLEAIHALGVNGFLKLASLNSEFLQFESVLFSDAAKATDRTLLTFDAVAQLDQQLAAFLPLLGPYLMDAPAGRVLEWLVRRFRINEFNVQDVLALFFPYHESPHFTKMVTILHISDETMFRFLSAHKSTAKALRRNALVTEMLKNTDLSRFISNLLPHALIQRGASVHKALVVFHAGVLLDFIARSKTLDEGTAIYLLAASLDPLQTKFEENTKIKNSLVRESILGSLLVLAAMSQKCSLSLKALKTIFSAISSCIEYISAKQFVRTVLCICAPQDEVEKLPRSLINAILALPGIDTELDGAVAWVGSEKLIVPLVKGLVSQSSKEEAITLLNSLLAHVEMPESIFRRVAFVLLHKVVEPETPDHEVLVVRAALSKVQQRRPQTFQQTCEQVMNEGDEQHSAVEQVLSSLSMARPGSAKKIDKIVASIDADANIRAAAVRDLLAQLTTGSLSSTDAKSIKSALSMRIQDPEPLVLEALYSNPKTLVPVLLEDALVYINLLVTALQSSPHRGVLRLHLSALAAHIFAPLRQQDSILADRIVHEVVFPYLLFSKPRQKTVAAVWDILEAHEAEVDGLGRYELLGGCVDAVRWEQAHQPEGQPAEESYQNTELMTKINLALAAKMADNILASNNYSQQFDALLAKLTDSNIHSRALGLLVTRALLSRLSGEHQAKAAYQVLEAMKLESLDGMSNFMRGVDNLNAYLHDMSLVTAVVLKPNSQHTVHRLQVAVLSMLPLIQRPGGVSLNWLAPPTPVSEDYQGDIRGGHYVQLMRVIYSLSNSTSSLPLLSTFLLRALMLSLADDALSFLAGIWLFPWYSAGFDGYRTHVRVAALRHAAAFLEAHNAASHWLDFQTILPALLVAMQDEELRVREAAFECIAALVRLAEAKNMTAVYAYDTFYGSSSGLLQYLDWSDFRKYLAALAVARSHFLHDAAYIRVFHSEQLTTSKSDSNKTTGIKQRTLSYLLSHANACQIQHVKQLLLRSVEIVSNEAKSRALQPAIQAFIDEDAAKHDQPSIESFVLAIACFDVSAAPELNNKSGTLWTTFDRTLRFCLTDGSVASAKAILLENLKNGLYHKLSAERQIALSMMVLDVGVNAVQAASDCKQLLSHVLTDVPIILQLVLTTRPTSVETIEPANKRARLEGDAADNNAQNQTTQLILLAEVLASNTLPGSLDLVTYLLETLKAVQNSPINQAERSYVQQLLMTAIENTISNIPSTTTIPAGAIRVEILVELLRGTENPQTFHQVLLLMASIARLAPDTVLHNIMPIFTFMGSNVLHRDDAYSFRVVQKTVESIVPVMASSLKDTHKDRLELYIASRDILRIFTDAAHHVPRHRRARFFSHLVDVLGPDEFLAPVCMLLVERMASRVVRQTEQEARASLFLPLTMSQHYSTERQLNLLIEVMHEALRLLSEETGSEVHKPTFLDMPTSDDQPSNAPAKSTRRALALLIYSKYALTEASFASKTVQEQALSTGLLGLTLRVATLPVTDDSRKEIAVAARTIIANTLRALPATGFVTGVLAMVNSQDRNVQSGALELFAERLPNVTDKVRREVTSVIVDITECIKQIIVSERASPLAHAAYSALRTISETTYLSEEGSLTVIVPLALDAFRAGENAKDVLTILMSLCSKLGPRIIPHLRNIVQMCVTYVQEHIGDKHDLEESSTTKALNVLQTLLTCTPAFWRERELIQVIDVYLNSCGASPEEIALVTPVIKTLAKRVPSKILLSTLNKSWASLQSLALSGNSSRFGGYFYLMKRSLRSAPRPIVLEHLRQLFKTFQDAFELSALDPEDSIEDKLIASFLELVIKLNETAFRPLFRKLCDWAFSDNAAVTAYVRTITFCHIYGALLDYFKALMAPYMTYLWQPFLQVLEEYQSSGNQNSVLWMTILDTITKTLTSDEGGFWRNDKLQKLLPTLVKQIPVCVGLHNYDGKAMLSGCLEAATEMANDDALLKSMNLDILMHTRSEDARLRLYALSCSEAIWRAHGGKLIGFASETITFVAECAEDENDRVVREAHKLKDCVESIAGKIDV